MSPDTQTLLSNAHDSTVRTWDVRPFAPADRRIQTYDGAPTGQERNLLKASWDSKGEKIAAGSGDQSVAIWETRTGKLLNKLPGHRGAVNDVRFHPLGEPICKCLQSLSAKAFGFKVSPKPESILPVVPTLFEQLTKALGTCSVV
jgi:Prp8 binding protein